MDRLQYQKSFVYISATNVAETSVTIPGIVYVVDSGLAKEVIYDEFRNMGELSAG